ncbi:putative bifunctional diguanylate cyclase/phosphodiesterase [Pseudomonas zhanjiangensis]|uniref:Bifunctional diguanylate cyclase/phosphodiesterase n=1 Tax=Pseudomonas zhanjiangensis TaxID=3239015 RepID=A0ABV3YP25_9PSED
MQIIVGPTNDGAPIFGAVHAPLLLLLTLVLACVASYLSLQLLESASHSARGDSRRIRRALSASCLAMAIGAPQLLAWLAQAPAPGLAASLLIGLLVPSTAAALALHSLNSRHLHAGQYLLGASCIGLGIAAMHFSGMAPAGVQAPAHYQPLPFALATLLAIAGSLGALLLGRAVTPAARWALAARRCLASVLLGLVVVAGPLLASWPLTAETPTQALGHGHGVGEPGQLEALILGGIALLSIFASLGAAWADKRLARDKRWPQRINSLLEQLSQAQASLQRVASFDPLTGLLNRQGLNQALGERLQEHAQEQPLAVMFIDIDHFKRINESLGHKAGDELLKVVVERVRSALRDQDVLARFGSDEFCLLAALQHRDEARPLALRVMQCMQEPFALAGRSMVMTLSIGISLYPDDGRSGEELLKHADLALYQAKSSGRNSLQFFSTQLRTKASLELQLEEELRHAIHRDRGLELYYQPILDLHSGELNKLEALVRWQHPQHGLLAPDRFIGIAEANGFVAELDAWVLRRACRDLSRLNDSGYRQLRVAVNCSALNLGREELVQEVDDALRSFSVQPQRLELEVTENALMGNINQAANLLQQIRALGVSLSIDDFGTGYSSLAYLKRLPLDTLKIDRSFLMDIPDAQTDMQIIQAIIAMSHSLRLKVVAEGVETPQQLAFLREHDCDFIQGFLLSPPLPLAQLQCFLDNYRPAVEATHILLEQG